MNLKFYTSVAKGLKLKVKNFWGISPTFLEVTWEKGKTGRGGGGAFYSPILNRVNLNLLVPVEASILEYKNHPNLNVIRCKISKLDNPNFYFEYTYFDQTLKELEKLDPKKYIKWMIYLLK